MIDPVDTLLGEVERALAGLPGAGLGRPASPGSLDRLETDLGKALCPGYRRFLERHDGADLGPDARLLTAADAVAARRDLGDAPIAKGLLPVLQQGARRFALDYESDDGAGEWSVFELGERTVDRVGSTFLRFLHALAAELAPGAAADPAVLARERCLRDPAISNHWLDAAEIEERAGRVDEMDRTLALGLRASLPIGPALLLAAGLRRLERGEADAARASLEDAAAADPLTGRDDDARLDAAAVLLALAVEAKDDAAAERARKTLGDALAATATFWRLEVIAANARGQARRADLALRVTSALAPGDPDVPRLRAAPRADLETLWAARETLDAGKPAEALAKALLAAEKMPDLGVAHALVAEASNAVRDPGAEAAARRATEKNPALVDGWRELGDAHLEKGDARAAEEAFRQVVTRDPGYGLGFAKLAQSLVDQGRTMEALQAVTSAAERGGDPFFVAAIRGDIYAEMGRHAEAAEAYDDALRHDPEDHWALHQAAVEHAGAGHDDRAVGLYQRAIASDVDGCPQTFVDYAELLRRLGRIGDAVKMYRRAVKAVPGDPEWKQALREAEAELASAPN